MLKAKMAMAAGIVAGFAALLTILGLWQTGGAVLMAAGAALVSMLPLLVMPRQLVEECGAGRAG